MITPLEKTALHDLLNKPILFDANIFMVGISERVSDKNSSFENMKQLYYAKQHDNSNSKALKSVYKKHCADVIKRHRLPPTLGEYIKACQNYL